MYLRVQLFHLDNIAIHLGFYFFLLFLLEQWYSSSLRKHWGVGKKIFNKQISDKRGTAVSYTPTEGKQLFTWLPLQIHASPAAVNCRRGRWFMPQKQTVDL